MLRIEHALHPWVAFLIVPLFALANAGVNVQAGLASAVGGSVPIAVIAGLVIGKQVGITLGAAAVVRLGLASLPTGVTWRHIYGAAWLGGIGFTMSLFIAALAYGDGTDELAMAKIGVLAASVVAGLGGFALLRAAPAAGDARRPTGQPTDAIRGLTVRCRCRFTTMSRRWRSLRILSLAQSGRTIQHRPRSLAGPPARS